MEVGKGIDVLIEALREWNSGQLETDRLASTAVSLAVPGHHGLVLLLPRFSSFHLTDALWRALPVSARSGSTVMEILTKLITATRESDRISSVCAPNMAPTAPLHHWLSQPSSEARPLTVTEIRLESSECARNL